MTAAPHRRFRTIRALLLASSALALGAGAAFAQEADRVPPSGSADAPPEAEAAARIVVVGTQIRGAEVTDALPVTVVSAEEISTMSAASGDDLFRSIPQLGDVTFTPSRTIGSLNDARGDTASINLRALGTGNTLVLLNGRRMVNHPGTQAENSVPVVTANTNSIPVLGVDRVEVLLDGASAIYGADAVAGVVNTVLKSDFEGLTAEVNVGAEDGVSANEVSAALEGGWKVGDNANLSIFASYFTRDPIFARDRDFTANADQRFRGGINNTSTTSAWGGFDRFTTGNLTVNGTTVSNAAGQFHIQPGTLTGCLATLPNGLCIDDTATRDAELRYNVNDEATVQNGVDRINGFLFFNNKLGGGMELFAEGGLYYAQSLGFRESAPMLGAVPIVIPASNYYNPFGPIGSPNRLANTNAPAGGLDIILGTITFDTLGRITATASGYRPVDAGPRRTEVENMSTRTLLGLRGDYEGWEWETALLYSRANSEDKENRISNTLFQQALGRSTPDAYNPFNGGCLDDLANGDCTPTFASTIAEITVPTFRRSETSLASWDVKYSRPDLFTWYAGDIGAAIGIELRRETFADDRDPRQDGTINFTDSISGLTANDLLGNNPSLDVSGQRDVQSGYIELAVPFVSKDQNIPLVQSIDAQLAVRYENFDYFGSVTKPKIALSWRLTDFLMLRSAWSKGFRAPNLQQQFERGLTRSNPGTDFLRCEAATRRDAAVTFATTCSGATAGNADSAYLVTSSSLAVVSQRSGSTDLQPEESENMSAGFVLESTFLPEEWGAITFTADWWRIKQEGVIATFGDANQILLDYARRIGPGCNVSPLPASCTNPNVVRGAPTAEDIAAFAGTGIQPVGAIQFVQDNYLNALPRDVQGLDLGLYYKLEATPVGDFDFRINAAYLSKFFQDVTSGGQEINAVIATGEIPIALAATGEGDLIGRALARPEWRYTGALTWKNGAVGAGWFTSYVASVLDGATDIGEYQTHNVYLQYEAGHDSDSPTRLRLGVRNLFDETPPVASNTFGYSGELHNPAGRFLYLNVRKVF